MDVRKYEDILRRAETKEKILKQKKRINVFKGGDAVSLLGAEGMDPVQARGVMQGLLNEGVIFKVSASKRNPQDCDVVLDQRFDDAQLYVLTTEKASHLSLILCGLFVFVSFCIVLLQMWPRKAQRVFSYLSYPLGGFIIFIGGLAVVRLILFGITYVLVPPGIWLFPNLFEDVGFFESFVPLWEYHGARKPKDTK